MKLFILRTGLFPEKVTIEEAVTGLTSSHEISYFDTERSALTEEDWNNAAQEIVAADRVLTL